MLKRRSTTFWIGLALIPQILLLRILANFPNAIEHYYSQGLYPIIAKGFRYAFGWLPFSFGDLFYTACIVLILREIVLLFKKRFRNSKAVFWRLLATLSVVYFSFHLLWGLNYYRLPMHQSLGIDKEYTTQDLVALTELLIEKSNNLHQELAVNDSAAVVYAFAKAEIFKNTIPGYDALKTQFPHLDYPPKSIKTSLLSYPLTYMGYSGYLNPITQEAQINGLIPQYHQPMVSCHEQAHQLGYAKENEANFMGVLATLNNPDPYFQYSGSVFALRYCINDVYRRDESLGEALRDRIRPGIIANYAESRAFWDSYENPLEPIFDSLYSGYLKANNQPGGIQTYSYMVALLVNYNKDFPGKI